MQWQQARPTGSAESPSKNEVREGARKLEEERQVSQQGQRGPGLLNPGSGALKGARRSTQVGETGPTPPAPQHETPALPLDSKWLEPKYKYKYKYTYTYRTLRY